MSSVQLVTGPRVLDPDPEQHEGFPRMIRAGNAKAVVSAFFNRVAGDSQTDTDFAFRVYVCAGDPKQFDQLRNNGDWLLHFQFPTDGDPSTWEEANVIPGYHWGPPRMVSSPWTPGVTSSTAMKGSVGYLVSLPANSESRASVNYSRILQQASRPG